MSREHRRRPEWCRNFEAIAGGISGRIDLRTVDAEIWQVESFKRVSKLYLFCGAERKCYARVHETRATFCLHENLENSPDSIGRTQEPWNSCREIEEKFVVLVVMENSIVV